ncbi:MAG TPA: hypothetical protein VFP36_01755 [Usitatibacter sp.]|nr:hypothetical protein [Usitatibacter sp.]
MRRGALALAMGCLCGSFAAAALDEAQWPPPPGVAQRMRELQHVIIDRDSTLAQREAAREELAKLLRSPAGQARARTPDEKPPRPARAAIEPFPSVVKPAERVPTPAPPSGVARVEVVEPPKPVVIPQTGAPATPSGNFAIDPRTGNVLHGIPGGYIDPRTGQVVPR